MKNILLIIIMLFSITAYSQNRIAVVKSDHDTIEDVLKAYKISFDLLKYHEISIKTLKKYDSVFFPCSIEPSFSSSIKVQSYNRSVTSVEYSKNFKKVKKSVIYSAIEDFIEDGGSAYFSGLSYKIIQYMYKPMKFHHNFPPMGLPGRIESKPQGTFSRFYHRNIFPLYLNHWGWIAVKKATDVEVLSSGTYLTAKGKVSGPISMIFKRGNGEFIFTSYHSTMYSDFRRFHIYRIAGAELFNDLKKKAQRYHQNEKILLADALRAGEYSRKYKLTLEKGTTTVFIKSQLSYLVYDFISTDGTMIASFEPHKLENHHTFESKESRDIYIKVYGADNKRNGIFAIITAHGARYFPYYLFWIFGVIGTLLILTITYFIYIYWFRR